jgi:hypothetical protein
MALATLVAGSRRVSVFGSKRVVTMQLNIANTNTYVDNAIKLIQGASIDSSTTTAVGATLSGATITFATGGAVNNALVTLIGY